MKGDYHGKIPVLSTREVFFAVRSAYVPLYSPQSGSGSVSVSIFLFDPDTDTDPESSVLDREVLFRQKLT